MFVKATMGIALGLLVFQSGALAEEPAVTAEGAPQPQAPAAKAPAAQYSLPWQLRPAAIATVLRSDTAVAAYEGANGESGVTVATTLLGSYKLTPEIGLLARVAVVENSPPGAPSATSFVNPVLGGTYMLKPMPDLRLAFFLGLALPIGMGGGNSPDPAVALASSSGVNARSAMDNAMFAVNDLTVFPGVSIAYVAKGLTLQAEATILQLTRVRGADRQVDSSKTNFTSGLHAGFFLMDELSLGAEIRYQRWLSTPSFVEATPARRETTTFAVGPRVHLDLGDGMWIRPGLAYARGLDDPMTGASYHIVQIDVPMSF